jgi:plasmid maintenance system antidote protein VapI
MPLLNGHASISPELAMRLSKAFGRTPQGSWLQLQMNYDLARINQQADLIQMTRFGRPEPELMPAGA